jgi:hypothetical protein
MRRFWRRGCANLGADWLECPEQEARLSRIGPCQADPCWHAASVPEDSPVQCFDANSRPHETIASLPGNAFM